MTEVRPGSPPVRPDTSVPASIFRAYDIRGIVDAELTKDVVTQISHAIGSEAREQGINRLLVGYDGRLSSPRLSRALIDGLLESGCDVVNLGLVPTPLLYFAAHTGDTDSGVMLTASHNPANYNGIKIVFRRSSLADNQIQDIRQRIEEHRFLTGQGRETERDVRREYRQAIADNVTLQRPLKLVVDCGNAVPAVVAPQLFRDLGCEVHPLFCEVDGHFPNHHPDPTVPDNLRLLSDKVQQLQADLGVAFDGDGDRLGVVTERGEFIAADRLLMLLAQDILPRYPAGAPVVFDVKCSRALVRVINELDGEPVMHRSGHSFMKQKMQETGAPLGGEFAAHVFLKDRWYGFDDGLYTAARLLEILSRQTGPASEIFAALPGGISTGEIKLPMAEDKKFAFMDRLQALAAFPDGRVINLDGIRVEFEHGWGLIRASNTSPALLMRFEADDHAALADIQQRFKALIQRADKTIDLSFSQG